MLLTRNVAEVLGLPVKDGVASSPFVLMARIADGLPIGAVERVANLVAPRDVQFKYRLVPKATYERRKTKARLSADEGTRLARLARVWGLAREVWQDDEAAREFLFRPHAMLEDHRPIDAVLLNEFGAEMVLDILNGLRYGSAA